jgi:hypothetical protein
MKLGLKLGLLFLLILVLLGVGVLFLLSIDDGDGDSADMATSADITNNLTTLNELLARGSNLMCTFADTDDIGNTTSGTTYFSENRMRANFTLIQPGQPDILSHAINDGRYQYLWTNGEDTGFKSLNSTLTGEGTSNSQNSEQYVGQDEEFDFDCRIWTVDELMFQPPSTIKFTDIGVKIQQLQEATEGSEEILETDCATIEDPIARKACQQAS